MDNPDGQAYRTLLDDNGPTATVTYVGENQSLNTAEPKITYVGDSADIVERDITPQLDKETWAAAAEFLATSGGNPCLLLTGPLQPGTNDEGSTEGAVMRCCRYSFGYPGKPVPPTIDLILDTQGGFLDVAFKIVLYLSRYSGRIRVFVPRRAKSAGTLVAVGATELFLSPFAELGPLDTQIADPRNPTKRLSALDCYQSVDYVREFGLNTIEKSLDCLLSATRAKMPLGDLVNISREFSLGSVEPLLCQVKALDFGGWGRTLKIGEMYATALLIRRGHSRRFARRVAERLVYAYTHHPYPIDMGEAQRIGLDPQPMDEKQYDSALGLVNACKDVDLAVGFFTLNKVAEQRRPNPVEWSATTSTTVANPQRPVVPPVNGRQDLACTEQGQPTRSADEERAARYSRVGAWWPPTVPEDLTGESR